MRPLGAVRVTRRRRAGYTTDSTNFKRIKDEGVDATIWASIQPMSQAEVQRVRELYSVEASFKAYTADGLRPKSEVADTPEDEVLWNNGWYKVVARDPHGWGLSHDKVFLELSNSVPVEFSSAFSSAFAAAVG